MNKENAKSLVVRAGLKLAESGLIVRTWGNVSCRSEGDTFAITPSGRDYLTLASDDIVEINIKDCSYSGSIMPSSERGIHWEVYKLNPKVNFVIHTHQENASLVSTLDLNSMAKDEIVFADYALPGSPELKQNVLKALKGFKGNAVIMKNHGALCFGKDFEEAFKAAYDLENQCKKFIEDKYYSLNNKRSLFTEEMCDYALSLSYKEKVEGLGHAGITLSGKDFQNTISEFGHIIINDAPEVKAASDYVSVLEPLLDDFAQIVGVKVKNVDSLGEIKDALNEASGVLVKGKGALCRGETSEEAIAVCKILQKNCKALVTASLFGSIKPLEAEECLAMRNKYLEVYSKLK